AEREHYNQQICENKNNSGAMWKTIRSALPNKSGRPSFTKDTDTLVNEFNRFFISVGQKAADDSAELARLHDLPTTPVYLGSTHCDELHIYKAMDKKEITALLLIDLSKAFESICHRTLLTKLKGLGASNEALN
ncbi:hypothetical protein P5673_029001, partial [Acropora cervicornis]